MIWGIPFDIIDHYLYRGSRLYSPTHDQLHFPGGWMGEIWASAPLDYHVK